MGHYEESRSVEEINKTMVLMRGIGKKGNFVDSNLKVYHP